MKHLIIIFIFTGFSLSAQVKTEVKQNNTDSSYLNLKSIIKINEMEGFKKITWKDISENAVSLIENWMLVAAGKPGNYNMMTANWGTLGWLWGKPVSTIFVRPHRYTHDFTEREDYYTLTFFKEEYREVLELMGDVSGRDFDKMNYEGLHPLLTENGSIAFSEAYMIIECKKLFATNLKEEDFVDTKVKSRNYPKKDFHTMYVGEITGIWIKE